MRPVAWTVAGSDSGGSAGLQADLRAFQALGVHGATVVTAITAQSPREVRAVCVTPDTLVLAQLEALQALPPAAVKTGMLGDAATVRAVARFFRERPPVPLIVDPVMIASSGASLLDEDGREALRRELLPLASLVTPNLAEAAALVGADSETTDWEKMAGQLLELGPREVLVKGGHAGGALAEDYWTDGRERAWLATPRRPGLRTHGTGCTLSAAVTAARACGYGALDSVVLAKAYLARGLRLAYEVAGDSPVLDGTPWPEAAGSEDLPWLARDRAGLARPFRFPGTGPEPLGFYPVVDGVRWLERLLPLGVTTAQLRVKGLRGDALDREVAAAVALGRRHRCRLFINDHWELALRHGAYGVHLGQEDLGDADLGALAAAGLRLGVSTHCWAEVARAHALRPSYAAVGPIFPTTAKPMRFSPQGVGGLARWRRFLPCPIVAIGGIRREQATELRAAGADGIAVISDVTQAPDPEARAREWLDTPLAR